MVKYKALRYDERQVVVQPTGPSKHDTVLLLCPSHFGVRLTLAPVTIWAPNVIGAKIISTKYSSLLEGSDSSKLMQNLKCKTARKTCIDKNAHIWRQSETGAEPFGHAIEQCVLCLNHLHTVHHPGVCNFDC
uniref:Uncharacterized protein n=1 Tax=Romanomermis culicivorax TaxID=13658 RepID=A0A915HL19_ROMCU